MKSINGEIFQRMVICGANTLHNYYPEIDALNVFPVPDGDTGTNMSLTFSNGAKDVEEMQTDDISEVAKKLSKGLLMGARGNSGVILSQIFRGFSMGLDGKKEINAEELAEALSKGAEIAYRAVMKPVEGTILTVIRESTEETKQYVKPGMDIEDVFAFFVKRAEVSLDHTPELLPVLKEVGVVDSGGAGLVLILSGFLAGLHGEEIKPVDMNHGEESSKENLANLDVEEQGFGYCTEFILRLDPKKRKSFTEDRLKTELSKLPGESIVVVQDDDIVKVHVHTLKPGNALNLGQRFGEFIKLKIENMQEQHNHIIEKEAAKPVERPRKEVAVISVAAGDGVRDMFMELHCDEVVNGGQTMNPSTEDIVAAIREVNANNVVILPNNSNIVMTAQQAAVVLEDEINVIVIPSKSIPQGLSACIMFNPEADLEENINEMNEAIANVKTGQVTFAIKDTNIDGVDIHANDYMALVEKKIVACIPDKVEACKAVLKGLVDDDSEIVTLIYGEDVTSEEAEAVTDFIENELEIEYEVHDGKQPVYSFIIGVE
ncbi:MAG TPA: DAK2 domain-containing protein [Candidatus Fimiplasma intestinipullorum]|uniref:DAK2 domain-containing protein n=1 Tax=Candidatus Fimiplasma intestinipullorum TaxID=2840825 RepID=A0A9D1L060_9FIRM|nr:DAK2 domain-containing protein [Candidatus Fimiplasma intestinipullorum]